VNILNYELGWSLIPAHDWLLFSFGKGKTGLGGAILNAQSPSNSLANSYYQLLLVVFCCHQQLSDFLIYYFTSLLYPSLSLSSIHFICFYHVMLCFLAMSICPPVINWCYIKMA